MTHIDENPQTWHVSVNNPGAEAATVQIEDAGMGLAGLALKNQTITVEAGGLAVLV